MDETRITITLRPIYIERIVYWVLIVALAVLLAISYLGGDDTSEQKSPAAAVGLEASPPAEEIAPPAQEPEESCSDGILNQDETDTDCGGSCTGCASGKSCASADDCTADYCNEGVCSTTAPLQLSGDVELKLTDIDTVENNSTGAVKVTGISYEITNGLEHNLNTVTLKVFLKSKKDNGYCLNQVQGSEHDCPDSYAQLTVPGADSGETLRRTQDLGGWYTAGSYVSNYGASSYYQAGDEFNLWLYLYDSDGNLIDGETISAFRTVR